MKRFTSVIILSLAFSSIHLVAQSWDLGVFGGISNYSGDLVPEGELVVWDETHPAVGGFIRMSPQSNYDFRFSILTGTISGTDDHATDQDIQVRNLSFKSNFVEASLLFEYNFLGYDAVIDRFSPYFFAGLAGLYHNPKALYQGEWVELQPLTTEGQGTTAFPNRNPYSKIQLTVPAGLGIKIGIGSGLTLGLEGGIRFTMTDYLDDVSQTYVDPAVLILENENGILATALSNRTGEVLPAPMSLGSSDIRGDGNSRDWYGLAGATFSYTIGALVNYGKRKKSGCPNWF